MTKSQIGAELEEDGVQFLTQGSSGRWFGWFQLVEALLFEMRQTLFELVYTDWVFGAIFWFPVFNEIDHQEGPYVMPEELVLHFYAVFVRGISDDVEVKLLLRFRREVLIGLFQKFGLLHILVSMREYDGVHDRHKVFQLRS